MVLGALIITPSITAWPPILCSCCFDNYKTLIGTRITLKRGMGDRGKRGKIYSVSPIRRFPDSNVFLQLPNRRTTPLAFKPAWIALVKALPLIFSGRGSISVFRRSGDNPYRI
jgi:hypothetical protein